MTRMQPGPDLRDQERRSFTPVIVPLFMLFVIGYVMFSIAKQGAANSEAAWNAPINVEVQKAAGGVHPMNVDSTGLQRWFRSNPEFTAHIVDECKHLTGRSLNWGSSSEARTCEAAMDTAAGISTGFFTKFQERPRPAAETAETNRKEKN